jgi:hypothetical protein
VPWRTLFGAALVLALATPVRAITVTGNGIYDIAVNTARDGFSMGSWAAATAASHPTGGGHDLLYSETGGSFYAATNFSSLRVYHATAPSTYTFDGSGGGVDLDAYHTGDAASPLGTGFRTTWNVTDEGLGITQDVFLTGTEFANSAIYHTVLISNMNTYVVDVGWRNLYDWQVDDPTRDDGPNNQVELADGTVVVPATTTEFLFTPTGGQFVRVSIDPGTPTYQPLLAMDYDPGFVPSLPVTMPDAYAYARWPSSFSTAFDYTIGPAGATSDSAGLSWFGPDVNSALSLPAGGSVRITQVLFGVLPDEPPPGGVIPEPGTIGLLGIGLLGLLLGRHRKE